MKNRALLLIAFFALTACGKVGDPEPPRPDQFPHQYPAAEPIPELAPGAQAPGLRFPPSATIDPLRPAYP